AAAELDLLEGSADLAVFGGTERALEDADAAARRLRRVERGAALARVSGTAAVGVAQGVTTLVVLVLGLGAVSSGALDPVMLPVIVLVTMIAFDSVSPLVPAVREWLESEASAVRVVDVLDARPAVSEPTEPVPAPAGANERAPDLEVRDLTVRYVPGRPPAIHDVSLTVP